MADFRYFRISPLVLERVSTSWIVLIIFSPTTVNLNLFILQQNKDLTDDVITNYKINQPFTSDFSVEEEEKNSNRT